MPPVFREKPSNELVTRILTSFGLTRGLCDTSWFNKQNIKLLNLEQLLPELEPFYIPCKANDYLNSELTPNRAITILRQILKEYNSKLLSSEKSSAGEKTTWYHIQSYKELSNLGTIEMVFS